MEGTWWITGIELEKDDGSYPRGRVVLGNSDSMLRDGKVYPRVHTLPYKRLSPHTCCELSAKYAILFSDTDCGNCVSECSFSATANFMEHLAPWAYCGRIRVSKNETLFLTTNACAYHHMLFGLCLHLVTEAYAALVDQDSEKAYASASLAKSINSTHPALWAWWASHNKNDALLYRKNASLTEPCPAHGSEECLKHSEFCPYLVAEVRDIVFRTMHGKMTEV